MNANVKRSNLSFYTSMRLKRTPASEDNRSRCQFIDGHEFSFRIDKDTKELRCVVTSQKEN